MRLENYRTIFIAIGLIGILLIATPVLGEALRLPMGEPFSEVYILGSDHLFADYPFNVTVGPSYLVYVDVGNQMVSSNYYVVYVKFRNETGPLPNSTTGAPSPLQPLYEYRVFLQKSTSWESTLNFSISNGTVSGNQSLINKLIINGNSFNVNTPSSWNIQKKGIYYELFFELWSYDFDSNSLVFNNRFVSLQLNFTGTIASS